jgi:RimJ/RimL family protein N-acetyltransferase
VGPRLRHRGRPRGPAGGLRDARLAEIFAFVHPGNDRSLAVARRLGMVEEDELPHPSRDHTVKILRIACSTS